MNITSITVELSTKNIIVEYTNDLFNSEGEAVYKEKVRKGLSPHVYQDWEFLKDNQELNSYREIAWFGLETPEDEITNFEEI